MELTCLALLALHFPANPTPALPTTESPGEVRLVVVLSVDSLFPDQLNRLAPHWTGGFARLLAQGTRFPEAALTHAITESAPGHASLGSGCSPAEHGITRDVVLDSKAGLFVPSVSDLEASVVTTSDLVMPDRGSASGKRLERTGWATELRAHWPESKSISISAAGSAAVLIGGKGVQLPLWWDAFGRGFSSSSAYVEELPPWLGEWNRTWPALEENWSWTAPDLASLSQTGTAADDRRGEGPVLGGRSTFPYALPALPEVLTPPARATLAGFVYGTPFMEGLVCQAAGAAVRGAGLGQDEQVDLLAIGLGTAARLSEMAGPYSLEVTDCLLRMDRQLGQLFDLLDAEVGEGRWILAMASDRGMLELPEHTRGEAIGGVRMRVRARRVALQAMRTSLIEAFGTDFGVNMTNAADGVIFRPGALEAAGDEANAAEVRSCAARALRPLPWVADTYTREELEAPAKPEEDPWLALYRNSYREDRGLEIHVRLAHRHLIGVQVGTRSGSPYPHDRRQSLLFLGPGFEATEVPGAASSQDALPTVLGRLNRVPVGDIGGRDLLAD